ncbi:MAG TPA: chitobiase/beta-hexosaminidase C-terminal domain-containing protein, partial [Mycobacteriales bacterium]|nr:chitobiase/beta-hexosaminidase C-terminal domain-containing protein [Mycobacteriales bacterium]
MSGLNLSGAATFTITYGSTAGGGSGATAPGTAAAQTWQAQEKSSSGGTLTNLGSSPAITVNDPTAPSAPNLSVGSFTNASATGTTVYIRQGSAGGFTVTGTSSDPESGIDHLTFPNGLGSGWSGGGQDNSSPYTGAYTFTTAAAAPGGNQNVTATNGWALTSSSTAFTVVADTTAPAVTAPSVTAGYYTSASVPVTVNTGSATDGGSGVDATTSILQSESGTLSGGICTWSGTWNSVTLTGGNDTGVSSGNCYRYRELLSDKVGNQGTSAVSNIAKVDTSAPSTPSVAFSGLSANAFDNGSGTLYIRPAAGGTFTVTAAATDAESGIATYTFGTLNSNGGANFSGSQSGDHVDYTFDGTTTAPSTARTVGVTNGAGTGSSNATYSITADTTAPTVSAPSVTAGYYTSLSVPVSKNGGSDGGSGVDGATSIVERDDTTLSNGACGSFAGSWSPVTLIGGNDTTVLSGHCYEYREKLSDHVGNQGTSGASSVAKVDTQAPANSLSLSNLSPSGSALKVGTRVYYRGAVTGGGSFKLTNAVTDGESAPASSATAALGGTTSGWTHTPSTVSTPAGGPYDSNAFSWSQGTTSSPTEVVTAADAAGNTTAAPSLTFTNDSNAPTGGALTVNGGATWSTTGNFNIDTRTDYTETQSANESGLASSTLTRASASLTNNSCGTYGSPTTIVGSPAQSLSTGCYLYTLTGVDQLGNTASVSATVKVDTSDPSAPTFGFSNFTGTTSAVGNTVFFLPTGTGSFDVTASSTDGDSDIGSYTFPSAASFGSGWSVSGSGSTRTYSYTPGAATPGSQSVTATDNAGLTASSNFSVIVSDTTPPTTTIQCNSAACLGSYYASAPVNVTLSADDGPTGAGVDVIRYTLDGSDPSPVNGSDYIGPIDIVATTTVKFRAYDNLGNEEAVGSQLVRVDSAAPTGQTITLTGPNAPYYTSNSVTFTTGNGSDADSGLDLSSAAVTRETGDLSGDSCSNFSADAGTFSSPDTVVSGGHCYRYTFTIADNVGHTSTPVTATAKIDTDNPSVSLTDPGTPIAGTVSLSAAASDASTSVQQVVFERSPAGAGTWTTIGTDTSAPYSTSWNTGAVADGLYDLRAVATDILGHTQADLVANRRVDNTAPDTSIDNGPADPSNDATPTFDFSSSESGSTFECRVDSGSWGSCATPHTTAALGAGSHTFDVRATDQAGNVDGTPASQTWTIDLTAPDTAIDSGPASPSGNATPTFDFSSSESGSTFECRLDSGSWSSCTSPHTTAALSDGSHTLDVRATDQAGNTDATPAAHTWTVDLTAPNTTIDSAPPALDNDATPTFDFSSSEAGSSFECRIDSGTWNSCTTPHTTAVLGEGTHTFDVRATDVSGNTDGTPASFTWTIDLTAPNTTIDSGPTNPTNDTTPTFAF